MENFTIPELTEIDAGYVGYLVTLKRNGKVTRLKVLRSSFSKASEKLWWKSKCIVVRTDRLERTGYIQRKLEHYAASLHE